MRLRLAILGAEIFCVELTREVADEALREVIAKLQSADDESPEIAQFGWGHSPHIERSPETDNWGEGEHARFGFGGSGTA
jgi:hypothetical protein